MGTVQLLTTVLGCDPIFGIFFSTTTTTKHIYRFLVFQLLLFLLLFIRLVSNSVREDLKQSCLYLDYLESQLHKLLVAFINESDTEENQRINSELSQETTENGD
uniref:Uncharacterized protein n=1 Tax=Glossina palpalis gambiensis TaxID=67801 RepID=A0A1B0BPT1_9MUSC